MSENDSEEHRALALKISRETMVLLKNDGVLPLSRSIKRIAVVGPLADQIQVLEGNYNGNPSRATTALEGIKKQFPGVQITFAAGTEFLRDFVVALPPSVLSTADDQPGLNAEYFQGIDLKGKAVLTRVDRNVDFDYIGNPPSKELGKANFSVRWSGYIVPATSAKYDLGATGDDGYRLWLDGKLLVEDWGVHAPSTKTAPVELQAGHKYAVKLEYFQDGGGAIARLVWSQPSAQGSPLEAALKAAREADVVIAVVGITSALEGEEMDVKVPGFKGGDRTSIDLPPEEELLLKAVKATGKPLVVVLMNGSALAVNWANQNSNAILEAWYSGEEGGAAIAETLAGTNNPAGRLPVTFYKGVDQLPEFTDYAMKNRTYRYFQGEPLYPFGYGLSYSIFSYSNLQLSAPKMNAGDSLTVSAEVKNTSDRAGDEVVQVYLTFPPIPGAPLRALRGFTRVHLAAGAAQHVDFTLSPRELSMVNSVGDPVVAPGAYRLSVGGGQPGTPAVVDAAFTIQGEKKLPE
jgi:beta-glucosidase